MQRLKIVFYFSLFFYSCHPNNEGSDIINKVINSNGYPLIKACKFDKAQTFNDVKKPEIPIDLISVAPFDSTPCVYHLIFRKKVLKDINKSNHSILLKINYFDNFLTNQIDEKDKYLIENYLDNNYKELKYTLDVDKLDAGNFINIGQKENDLLLINKIFVLEIFKFSKIYISLDGKKAVVYLYTNLSGGTIYYLAKFGKNWYISVIEST